MEQFENIQEIIDRLTFTDDGMFQAVLSDPEISAELVERLLHIKVDHVEYPELEKTIAPFYTTKGVRLDVYLKDSDKIIDIEMQCYPLKDPGKQAELLIYRMLSLPYQVLYRIEGSLVDDRFMLILNRYPVFLRLFADNPELKAINTSL